MTIQERKVTGRRVEKKRLLDDLYSIVLLRLKLRMVAHWS